MIVEVLLGLITIGVTITALVTGWIARELYNLRTESLPALKQKVNELRQSYYGTGDDGQASVHKKLDEIERKQETASKESNRAHREILSFLRILTSKLEEQDIDAPNVDEELDDDRLYRGEDD